MKSVNEYIQIAKIDEIKNGELKVFEVNDESVILINLNGEIFAYKNQCSHMELELNDAEIDGEILTCPWHGAKFDIRTGAVVRLPASQPLEKYEVKVEGDKIFIKI
ncbi:MAG: non-heme iron oxygenase ferredoxin subunit [Candidatus Kryptonium sp.]|nr:non-heme iron oxygenase ferredoxin subunit [Candidatus Kryptonium sp.]MCX7761981.1 non-heme iron oxygenase ferredoxin subunit [Candidatus Kryptonium sp.]MDW8108687.1 non-heme iron oxygenase ferredoxin subunit [Candidatus Kryptonium sp.]